LVEDEHVPSSKKLNPFSGVSRKEIPFGKAVSLPSVLPPVLVGRKRSCKWKWKSLLKILLERFKRVVKGGRTNQRYGEYRWHPGLLISGNDSSWEKNDLGARVGSLLNLSGSRFKRIFRSRSEKAPGGKL